MQLFWQFLSSRNTIVFNTHTVIRFSLLYPASLVILIWRDILFLSRLQGRSQSNSWCDQSRLAAPLTLTVHSPPNSSHYSFDQRKQLSYDRVLGFHEYPSCDQVERLWKGSLPRGVQVLHKTVSPQGDRGLDQKFLKWHLSLSRNAWEVNWSPLLSSTRELPMSFDLQKWSRIDLGAAAGGSLQRPHSTLGGTSPKSLAWQRFWPRTCLSRIASGLQTTK